MLEELWKNSSRNIPASHESPVKIKAAVGRRQVRRIVRQAFSSMPDLQLPDFSGNHAPLWEWLKQQTHKHASKNPPPFTNRSSQATPQP
jgi:hypothetical protein